MKHKSNNCCFSKFAASAMIAGALFFANIPCVMANGGEPEKNICNKNIKNMRECLAKALGSSPSDRSIFKALAPTLATNRVSAAAASMAAVSAAAASSMALAFGMGGGESSAE